jgi:hypothetical protein
MPAPAVTRDADLIDEHVDKARERTRDGNQWR